LSNPIWYRILGESEDRKQMTQLIAELIERAKQRGPQHWRSCIAVLLIGLLASTWIDDTAYALKIKAQTTQTLTGLAHFKTTPRSVTQILIDDGTFYWENKGRTPISPVLLARSVHALVAAEVSVIVVDLDFSDPFETNPNAKDPVYDGELNELKKELCAATAHARLVLPVALSMDRRTAKRSLLDDMPCPGPSVVNGLVNVGRDLRYVQLGVLDQTKGVIIPSLPLAIARAIPGDGPRARILRLTEIADLSRKPMAPFMNASAIPSFSASRLLSTTVDEARRHLQSQVALVMAAWSLGTPGSGQLVDSHDTPLGKQSGGFLVAAAAESLMAQDYYWPLAPGWVFAAKLIWLMTLAIIIGCTERTRVKIAAVAVAVLVNFFLAWILSTYGLLVDVAVPLMMMVAHPLVDEILEWRTDAIHWRTQNESS
jgi:hypothetical protein